nr:aminoglycoside phosphotransferase family protein [Yoonia tamlensis]
MQALFTYAPKASWPEPTRNSIRTAQNLAKLLTDNQSDIKPLHGDLHHDNIRMSARGYLAFDAKGLIGDPAYDLANAFLNPMDAPDIVADLSRVQQMAAIFAAVTQMPAARLLDWAIAHCALTLAWKDAALPDVTMLDLLMHARSVCGDRNLCIAEFNL